MRKKKLTKAEYLKKYKKKTNSRDKKSRPHKIHGGFISLGLGPWSLGCTSKFSDPAPVPRVNNIRIG